MVNCSSVTTSKIVVAIIDILQFWISRSRYELQLYIPSDVSLVIRNVYITRLIRHGLSTNAPSQSKYHHRHHKQRRIYDSYHTLNVASTLAPFLAEALLCCHRYSFVNMISNKNSSGDEIANVNFLRRYGTYVLQNTKKENLLRLTN